MIPRDFYRKIITIMNYVLIVLRFIFTYSTVTGRKCEINIIVIVTITIIVTIIVTIVVVVNKRLLLSATRARLRW